jgi:exonuclease III
LDQIAALLAVEQPTCMGLQECKLSHSTSSSSDLHLPGYSLIRKDRSAHGGGVAVAVAERLGTDDIVVIGGLPAPSSLEAVAAHISVRGSELRFTFVSIYRPPKLLAAESEVWLQLLHTFLSGVARPGWPMFLAGDFNLDRRLPEAQALVSALESHGYLFLSSQEPTHQKRTLDWFLTDDSSCSAPDRSTYTMLPPLEKNVHGHAVQVCDLHNYQGVGSITHRHRRQAKAPPVFIWSRLDAEEAKGMALGMSDRLPPSEDPDHLLDAISEELWTIAECCVPKTRPAPRHRNSPQWFNERCAQAYQEQKVAYNLRRLAWLGPDPARLFPKAHSFLKAMRKRLKVAVKKAKSHFIQRTLDKAKSDHSLWEVYGLLSGKRRRGVSKLLVEGETLVEPGRIAAALLEGFRGNFACTAANLGPDSAWTEEPLEIPPSAFISEQA